MKKRTTAGELSLKASRDCNKYDALEVGYALTEDIQKQLELCIQKHNSIFDEDQYCVGWVLASDPMLKNVMRRKFFAFLYLPKPRPNQCIFLYDKRRNMIIKRLWTLPNAVTMAELSEISTPDPRYAEMKFWCDAFFKGWKYRKKDNAMINQNPSHFFDVIRKQHGISMLSEKEYLNANRERLVKSCSNDTESLIPNSFDITEVAKKQVVNSLTTCV